MEYGVRLTDSRQLPADPRTICPAEWREILPPGQLRALYFGTEFCESLLPPVGAAAAFCLVAREAGLEAVMLTPLVTDKGLRQLDLLLERLITGGWAPEVVFNDWGVLNLLRQRYPDLPRRSGRLVNRALRDPRVVEARPDSGSGQPDRGKRVRTLLAQSGVTAVETDPDLEGGFLGAAAGSMQRVLYLPYLFVASSRNCLVKADGARTADECFTKGLGIPCNGRCQGRWHRVRRDDTSLPLWRAGNTSFCELPHRLAAAHLSQADRVVLFERPVP
ncbi:hypothetical protein [Geobacter argillaceus]|uniref:U32 family peptidase n=1 Tax=Geobacter argillaceus TaxID=345631 RepID=A0A562VLC8_9BACT|nr:hypothetical protein [Geobacter argillaceus]TWJ18729.1 hypothetical protein JN12_02549 [Geobacter argillaceus]